MSRSQKKEKDSEINKKEDEVESRWSFKRIAIFLIILGLLIFFLYYFIQTRVDNVLGEKEEKSESKTPQITLPQKENINEILQNAEEDISNINTEDIVSSQPQIQNAIKELEKLTSQDGIKENFCSSVCGK